MTWYFQDKEVTELPDDCVGFVYIITDTVTGRKYIGKKLAAFSRTKYKTVKLKSGKKKRKKIRSKIQSDWQTYYGSSEELKEDIGKLGTERFKREILHYCKSKAECNYLEAKEQFLHEVLESDRFYNNQIRVRVHGSHIKKLKSSKIKA